MNQLQAVKHFCFLFNALRLRDETSVAKAVPRNLMSTHPFHVKLIRFVFPVVASVPKVRKYYA